MFISNSFMTNISYTKDLSDRKGIKEAYELGLAESGLADVISTKYVSFAADYLFDVKSQKGRLFTLLRHPVEQVIMSYHHFLNHHKSSEVYTLQQYIASPYMKRNWLTHFLSTLNNLEDSANAQSLNLAKEILRKKCVVGVYENLEQSIELFVDYFGWVVDTSSEAITDQKQCIPEAIEHSQDATNVFFMKIIKKKYDIEYGGDIYNSIVAKNDLDMELYWYAYDLHKAQVAQMNPSSSSEQRRN